MSAQRMILHVGVALALALPLAAQTPSSVPVLTPDAGPTAWNAGPYTYDGSGNIVGIGGGYGNQSFRYDVNGRLVTSTITGPLGSTSEQFSYDAYANMLSHTIDGTTTSYPTTSSTNHLTSGINAAYDAAGNMTQWQPPGTAVVYHHSFDALHMMTESNATNTSGGAYSGAHRVIHVYTADDERAWTYDLTANESHWRIRGLDGKVLRDFDNTGTTWTAARDYLYRDGALLGAITPTGSEHYTLDHLGTPRFITDGSGNQVGLHTYRPFGQEWSVTDPTQEGNPLRFTGHERDADSLAGGANGLDYMHARFYDGPVGRFLSVDPIQGPPGWNGYSYVSNRPIGATDPTGLATFFGPDGPVIADLPSIDGGDVFGHIPTRYEESLAEWQLLNALLDTAHTYSYVEARDFANGAATAHGLEAWFDGVIPFAEPFADHGYYDDDDLGTEVPHVMGRLAQEVLTSVVAGQVIKLTKFGMTGAAAKLFGKSKGLLNANDYLRVGWSGKKGVGLIFRIAIGGKNAPGILGQLPNVLRHIDFW